MNKLKNIKPLTEGKMKSGVKEQKGTSKPIAPPPSPGSTSKNVTSIETFLNTELVNYASYDNIRKIASIMDGLKNSGRKVIATALDCNIKENLKVLQFSNKAAEHCVTGDTLVKTTEGYIRIDELVGREDVKVYCVDFEGNEVVALAKHIRKTKETTEIVQIKCVDGIISCTPEHRIMTQRGWMEAKDIVNVDFIRTTRNNFHNNGFTHIHGIRHVKLEDPVPVYDLEVPVYHNFIVTKADLKIHNCEYLHGSLDGVVVTLAKEYAGTNNLALLQGKGNFGTRFSNEASAPRYIYARKKDYLDDLFIKDDTKVLIEQHFEGSKIEPKFYTPTLPLLLINGSQGISSGFAQNILPRNANEMKEYLLKILDGVKPRKFPMPSFNGFEGTVIQGDSSNQFIIQGKVKKLSANRVLIEEIPVQYDLKGYISVLDKLEDDKLIQGYKDLSNDSFKFEVQIPSKVLSQMTDAELLEFLKLRRTVSENYTSMTHENKIKEYTNPEDILNDYVEVKLVYTEKRKQHLLNELASKIELLNSRYTFIEAVVENKLIISKRKKAVIINDIDKLVILKEAEGDTRYDYLLRMPVSSMTEEELKRLKGLVKDAEDEIKELKKLSAKDLWLRDIQKLKI